MTRFSLPTAEKSHRGLEAPSAVGETLVASRFEDRFWSKVTKSPDANGCWMWRSSVATGYGRIWLDGRPRPAHRVAYELCIGPIPKGLELDHLCRVPLCVNPRHLEPVTHAENARRGDIALGIRSAATHCVNGHEFTAANTAIRFHNGRAHRRCRKCNNKFAAESRRRKRTRVDS